VSTASTSSSGSPDAGELAGDGDRESITEVNGTVARFEMSYSPPAGTRSKFGPPWKSRLPSLAYLVGAIVLGALVWYAYSAAPSGSALFGWVVEGDRGRPLPARLLAAIILVSALATVARTTMRGVLVSDEWIEARYLLPFGIPKARRWAWPQVHRVVVDGSRIGLELWDGSFERLPAVENAIGLADLVVHQAQTRRIVVTVLYPTRT
jgi:hypothetical protein